MVSFLLHNKWRQYGRFVYYLKLFIYILFLFFLTGYSVKTTENPAKTVGNDTIGKTCSAVNIKTKSYTFFVDVGSVIIIVLAGWHILMEVKINNYSTYDPIEPHHVAA